MSNTQTIREQLTYKALLQIIFIIISILLTVLYTQPKLEEANQNVEQANIAIEKYNKLNKDGIEYWNLKGKIKNVGGYDSLIAVIDENIAEVAKQDKDTPNEQKIPKVEDVIKASWTNSEKPYSEWLSYTIKTLNSDKENIKKEKEKINSILPTLSPVGDTTDETSITLRNYISYVEQNILKKFNILSFSPLGITGINYSENQKNSKNPIGSFQMELNFDTTSGNIIKLLEYIKTSGRPDVLEENYNWNIPSIMTNPLITIDSITLSDSIGKENNKNIKWKIAFSFYIRGSHSSDQNYLFEALTRKQKEIETKIDNSITSCETSGICGRKSDLEKLKIKFNELNRSFKSAYDIKKSNTLEAMYLLTQQIQSLKWIESEYESIK